MTIFVASAAVVICDRHTSMTVERHSSMNLLMSRPRDAQTMRGAAASSTSWHETGTNDVGARLHFWRQAPFVLVRPYEPATGIEPA